MHEKNASANHIMHARKSPANVRRHADFYRAVELLHACSVNVQYAAAKKFAAVSKFAGPRAIGLLWRTRSAARIKTIVNYSSNTIDRQTGTPPCPN